MNVAIPRESIEFVETTVTVNGVAVVTGVTIAVVARGVRPTVFVAPTTLNGKIGYLTPVVALPAEFDIWAKVVSAPETPVVSLGRLTRT